MAYFSIKPSLISFLVLMFLLFAASTYASKVVDVNVICQKAKNTSFCLNILNSKPGGAKGVDLVSLAQYTAQLVRGKTYYTIDLIKRLIAHYEDCLSHFDGDDDAFRDIDDFQQMLKKPEYIAVKRAADAAITEVEEARIHSRYFDKFELPKNAKYIEEKLLHGPDQWSQLNLHP